MDIAEPNICMNLWRTNATGLSLDEYYADILLELPGEPNGFKTAHASVVGEDVSATDRRIFHIPDIFKLADISAKDPTGYKVLKHLATNKVKVSSGLPKLRLYAGFSNQSIQQILNPFHEKGQSVTLALSKDLLISCTTLIHPDGSEHGRLNAELLANPVRLPRWTWEIDLKDWPDRKPGLILGSSGPDFPPLWA